jgi:hypothetical protein
MLTEIPKIIVGAKTLFIAKPDIGFDTIFRYNKEIRIEYISVCQYDPEEGSYLFGCDKNFNTHADFYYDLIDEALDHASRIYQLENIQWTQVN